MSDVTRYCSNASDFSITFNNNSNGYLIEVRDGMLHDPEYDGLGRGEEERGQPGDDHHQPAAGVTLSIV